MAQIYVACLASYNAGRLYGAWIDCDGMDLEDLESCVAKLLAKSSVQGAEEYAIHDTEGFEGFNVGEFTSLSEVADVVALLDEHGDVARAAAELVCGIEDISELCTDKYCGQWSDLGEYAESLLEGQVDLPANLAHYFDYDAFGRDLDLGGDILTARVDGDLHIFDNH